MLAHQHPQPVRTSPGLIAPPEQYCAIPQRLLCDLQDTPVAIGIYALVARIFLVEQRPVPLSRADVLRYDPTLKVGAVKRALDRLLDCGWLLAAPAEGQRKQRYTPTWGRIKGAPLPWTMTLPCLGRPRHVIRLLLDRSLLDVCMGRLVPHPTQSATISRYLTTPALGLADIGCYALTLADLPRETAGLLRLGLVRAGQALAVPQQPRLLALISQRPLLEHTAPDLALTSSGTRRLGLAPAPEKAERGQPLFFVPPEQIGNRIGNLIGTWIGSAGAGKVPESASASPEVPKGAAPAGITWESRDSENQAIPPPNPPAQSSAHGGGDRSPPKKNTARAPRPAPEPPAKTPQENEASQLLRTLNMLPEQVSELSDMPIETIQLAIRDGQARPGIRDLAGWVVKLLRTHRDHGWTIAPPAPRAESPEDLRLAFARYAAAQEAERRAGLPPEQPWFPPPDPVPLDGLGATVRLWNQVQAALHTQLSCAEFSSWIRRIILQSLDGGVATIMAPNALVKQAIEARYLGTLRDLLALHTGQAVEVRVVLNPHAPAPIAPAADTPPDDGESRPAWITAERWAALPTMLRVTLAGATLAEGQVQGRDPFCRQLLAGRYAHDISELVAAAAASQ